MIASCQRCDLCAMGIREAIRHHDKGSVWFTCLCGNDGFELGPVVNRCYERFHCEGGSGSFEGLQPKLGIGRSCRIEEHRDPGNTWRNLLEQVHPLAP